MSRQWIEDARPAEGEYTRKPRQEVVHLLLVVSRLAPPYLARLAVQTQADRTCVEGIAPPSLGASRTSAVPAESRTVVVRVAEGTGSTVGEEDR